METQKPLLKDEDGEEVDVHMYRSMIGSLMYLTSLRPDIMFVVCACARYQVNLKVSHLHVVKRIFRYLKGQSKLGLWYPKDSPFDLVAYTDSDYAGASFDRKSTTGGKAKKSVQLMMEKLFRMELELIPAKTINGEVQLHALMDGKKIIITESIVRRDLQLEDAEDEVVHKELGDSLVRAATSASSLEAEQDSGNITKTQSKATLNESSSLRTTSGGGSRCQETMGDTIAQTRFKNLSKHSNDSLLARGNTLQSDEDRLKLDELMALCTILQSRVLDLEKTKTTQANEIASLKRRVKKLEKKISSRTHKLKRLYKGKINVIDADKDITLVNVQDNADKLMYDVGTMTGDEVFVEQEVAAKYVNLTVDEVTLAQALAALKSVKPKVKGDVIEEPNVSVNAASASTKAEVHDKGKGKLIEPKPVKKMIKKDQLRSDEEEAKRLHAKFDEEERLARVKDEANVALIEEWDDIQAKIKADHELA
ncbi:hypothetical protein Tco_0586305 [Tanacetum coccineum]